MTPSWNFCLYNLILPPLFFELKYGVNLSQKFMLQYQRYALTDLMFLFFILFLDLSEKNI